MDASYSRTITERGMRFSWQPMDDRLHVTLAAPTRGWLAVGFNTHSGLTGANLIMGAVLPDGRVAIEEHAIIQPGLHRPKSTLGLPDRISDMDGAQHDHETRLSFSLPVVASGDYSVNLVTGQRLHVLLAYSHHTDFTHHSAMRTHTEITL